ncbi:DUF397 domain-containing protein [Actinomadura craniellae]|uniref:DUF397 domain-containing protein n=1 Tax=Actinomadura craniellae TaxID=2231787 RepID=UPI001F385439|nr:DUF397 domain-containing protein [Actinomadura craniellae]
MNRIDLPTTWRKSSHSGGQSGDCVEVAQAPGVVGLRDSKNPAGPILIVHRASFGTLIQQVKTGELDLP